MACSYYYVTFEFAVLAENSELAATHQVHVNMVDRLASLLVAVHHQTKSGFVDALRAFAP
jgi:hypothetical protein